MITISNALSSLTPTAQWSIANNDYDNLVWLSPEIPKPSRAEVEAEVARLTYNIPFDACVAEAKKRLVDSDWAMLPDVNISNKAEFEAYRATVRALVFNPVASPVFPTEPQPVWL